MQQQDFYHLDYLEKEHASSSATAFAPRARPIHRSQCVDNLDFSLIQDPLIAIARSCLPCKSRNLPDPSNSSEVNGLNELEPSPEPIAGRLPTPHMRPGSKNSCDPGVNEGLAAEPELLIHVRVYALAEKYDVASLKQLAKEKFETALACSYDFADFAMVVEEVYCTTIDTDRGLRDAVLGAFRCRPWLIDTQEIYGVIKRTSVLAFELFKMGSGIAI